MTYNNATNKKPLLDTNLQSNGIFHSEMEIISVSNSNKEGSDKVGLHIGNCYDKNGTLINEKGDLYLPQLADFLTQIIRLRKSSANVVISAEIEPVA